MKGKTVRIDEEQYLELQRCFNEVLKQCTGVKLKINPEAWYDNQELMQILFISKRTAQHYRDSGLISVFAGSKQNILQRGKHNCFIGRSF